MHKRHKGEGTGERRPWRSSRDEIASPFSVRASATRSPAECFAIAAVLPNCWNRRSDPVSVSTHGRSESGRGGSRTHYFHVMSVTAYRLPSLLKLESGDQVATPGNFQMPLIAPDMILWSTV